MLENHNINSGDDYANLLIAALNEMKSENFLEDEMFRFWFIEIRKLCVEKYQQYITGKNETYMLSDEEIDGAYKIAVEQIVSEALEDLSEKGLLKISIDENGEVLYSLNEEGKKQIKYLE